MLSPEFISEMKQKLEQQKQKLQADLAGLASHTEVGDDYDENATEIEIDEVNQDLIARMKSDLVMIDKALAKIADGSYGTDGEGQEIAEDRLRALPWADTSI